LNFDPNARRDFMRDVNRNPPHFTRRRIFRGKDRRGGERSAYPASLYEVLNPGIGR